jgi:hypothetical protein
MALPVGLRGPQRIVFLIPAVVALVLTTAAAVFALAHFMAKGPAPQSTTEYAQRAGALDRGPYNAGDFTEPQRR